MEKNSSRYRPTKRRRLTVDSEDLFPKRSGTKSRGISSERWQKANVAYFLPLEATSTVASSKLLDNTNANQDSDWQKPEKEEEEEKEEEGEEKEEDGNDVELNNNPAWAIFNIYNDKIADMVGKVWRRGKVGYRNLTTNKIRWRKFKDRHVWDDCLDGNIVCTLYQYAFSNNLQTTHIQACNQYFKSIIKPLILKDDKRGTNRCSFHLGPHRYNGTVRYYSHYPCCTNYLRDHAIPFLRQMESFIRECDKKAQNVSFTSEGRNIKKEWILYDSCFTSCAVNFQSAEEKGYPTPKMPLH